MKKIYIKDLKEKEEEVLLCWISNKRQIGNKLFLDIYDSTGTIQAIAFKNKCDRFDQLTKVSKESAMRFVGFLDSNGDFVIKSFEVEALATKNLSPSPNQKYFDVYNHKYSHQIFSHPTFYIRNEKLKTIYYIKSIFKREIQNYFWEKGFMEFESPTLTRQTLYDDSGAIWLDNNHPNICLSRCATFHLEPAVIPFEKIFTIANSHADEKSRSNRHLIEFFHLKAEICWITLDELIEFAGDMYYEVAKRTCEKCADILPIVVDPKVVEDKLNVLNPKNHAIISYDEAVKLLKENGMDFEYGKSLSTKDEMFLTKYFGEKFVWVKYIPYDVEGFMFRRKDDNKRLTMTCDLIAPNGFGEILGTAEKMTNYDEVISSMKERNKYKDFDRYKDYVELHKYGLPYHGGIGMGIERALRFILNLEHVKFTKPFAVLKGTSINH